MTGPPQPTAPFHGQSRTYSSKGYRMSAIYRWRTLLSLLTITLHSLTHSLRTVARPSSKLHSFQGLCACLLPLELPVLVAVSMQRPASLRRTSPERVVCSVASSAVPVKLNAVNASCDDECFAAKPMCSTLNQPPSILHDPPFRLYIIASTAGCSNKRNDRWIDASR